jgi:hypothetical protein
MMVRREQLTLRQALASNQLEDFVRQEQDGGVEFAKGSELERALALLITRRRTEAVEGHYDRLSHRHLER